MARNEDEQEPVVVRDRRRIDPETGQRRSPESGEANAAELGQNGPAQAGQVTESMSGTLDDELAKVADAEVVEPDEIVQQVVDQEVDQQAGDQEIGEPAESEADGSLEKQVADLTADIKRVTAEYANYRKRVERDRESVIASAKASVAGELLTVLDDVERADAHGDLTGAFKAVTDKLISSLESAGLEAFGQEGDEFDPSVHEAVQHTTSSEVSGPTVTAVLRRGYRFGDRVLRPVMVAVTDHEPEVAEQPEGLGESGEDPVQQG